MAIVEPASEFIWDVTDRRGYANAMGRYKTEKEMAFISTQLGGECLHILDVGGGSGRFAVPLADKGHRVTVVDRSPEALEILRAHRHPNIDTLCGDFLAMESTAQFDAVIAVESVQYFTDVALVDVFAKVSTMLTPGGPFVFTGLNARSWRYQLHKLRRFRPTYNVTDPAGYSAALEHTGLTMSAMEGFVWMPLPVNSDSQLVGVLAMIERSLRLQNWIRQSPWLLIAARRLSSENLDRRGSGRL
jgi:SAM-dependent methyltransferase